MIDSTPEPEPGVDQHRGLLSLGSEAPTIAASNAALDEQDQGGAVDEPARQTEVPNRPNLLGLRSGARDEHYCEYMRSYCPYENCRFVKDFLAARGNRFPSIFATAGLSDYRVGYYEAAKWVARIRAGEVGSRSRSGEVG